MKRSFVMSLVLLVPLSFNALASNSTVSIDQLTLAQETGLSIEQIRQITSPQSGSGCGNTPDWMTSGNTPNWMTSGNTPDWMTSGNTPDWMTSGSTPNWYSNGSSVFRKGEGEIPNPKIEIEQAGSRNELLH